jgi:hypothetical protein
MVRSSRNPPKPKKGLRRRSVRALVNAVRKAGCDVARVEYDPISGKVAIITTQTTGAGGQSGGGNDLNDWLAKHARDAQGH